jgi:hypothetical protein
MNGNRHVLLWLSSLEYIQGRPAPTQFLTHRQIKILTSVGVNI